MTPEETYLSPEVQRIERDLVHKYVDAFGRSRAQLEDVVRWAVLEACQTWKPGGKRLKGWIYFVVRRRLIDADRRVDVLAEPGNFPFHELTPAQSPEHFRVLRAEGVPIEPPDEETVGWEERAVDRLLRKRVLSFLDPQERLVIEAREMGYTVREIARRFRGGRRLLRSATLKIRGVIELERELERKLDRASLDAIVESGAWVAYRASRGDWSLPVGYVPEPPSPGWINGERVAPRD